MARPPPVDSVPADAPSLANGRYAIASRIDAGGMSAVYRVWDRKLKVTRAMKVLLPEYARNQKIRGRFETEARTMARLEHPNLVRIYDVGIEAELPYLVMELVTGGSLQRWIDTYGAMPPRLAVEAALQLVTGLVVVHQAGVVHRDIKPHNVLVAEPGVCKLTDFGIAQLGDGGGSTKTGTTLGTQGYMAPEQRADAKSVDARADLYGVGATLWALLTGRPAHDVFLAVERDLASAPAYLHELLKHTTAYAREDRYADARELEAALRAALAQAPAGSGPGELVLDDTTDDSPIREVEDEIVEVLRRGGDSVTTPDVTATPVPVAPTAPSPVALPYYMPTPGRTRRSYSAPSESDAEPDWIARDEPSGADRSEEVIGMGLPVAREPTPPPPQGRSGAATPPPASTPAPAPTPAGAPTPTPAPPPKKLSTPPPPAPKADEEEGESSVLWVWLLGPVAGLLLGALLLVLLAGGWVSVTTSGVRAAEQSVIEHRGDVYDVLKQEEGAVQAFKQAGVDTTALEAGYLEFRDAREEPERERAARAFLALLVDETERSLAGESASPAQAEAAHSVRRIRSRVGAWDDAQASWEAACGGVGGRLVTALGLVRAPEPR
jgi:serine/threonine protein kinase